MWLQCLLCLNKTFIFHFFLHEKTKQHCEVNQRLYISWSIKKTDHPQWASILHQRLALVSCRSPSSHSIHHLPISLFPLPPLWSLPAQTPLQRLHRPPRDRSQAADQSTSRQPFQHYLWKTKPRILYLHRGFTSPIPSTTDELLYIRECSAPKSSVSHTTLPAWASLRPVLMVWWENRKMTVWGSGEC